VSILTSQYGVYAKILSYVIYNTRDLAQLRQISKEWNQHVIPFALKSAGFIKNCYPNTEYIRGLVGIQESQYRGYKCNVDALPCGVFNEGGTIQSILFTGERWKISDTVVKCIDEREEAFDSKFEGLLSIMLNTKSFSEFESVADISIANGMYLSMEDREEKKTKYEARTSGDIYDYKHGEYFTGLVTVEIPRSDVIIAQSGGVYPNVNLHANTNEDDDGECFYPIHRNGTYKGYVIKENEDTITCAIPMCMKLDDNFLYDNSGSNDEDIFLKSIWSKSQERSLVPEGIALADALVPNTLHQKLMDQIDLLGEKTEADYHPHSNGIVRDLVHPALYSYVKGTSTLKMIDEEPPATFPNISNEENEDEESSSVIDTDYWGRAYEGSTKYQWLPTYFDVDTDGTCNIADYINNLVPRSEFESLYESLSQLFSQALPLIESVFSYGRSVRPRIRHEVEEDIRDSNHRRVRPIDEVYHSLRGKRLQVITKIVDYELKPGQSYEGVWHVEGMSHEEIVATCIYFIHRDDDIKGGDLLFKRAFHVCEASYIFSSVRQCRPPAQENAIDEGILPLGKVETLSRRLLVFPNSHVHKVTKLENQSTMKEDSTTTNTTNSVQKRRIIVFFLINPEKRIVSTREVPPQQQEVGGNMSREDAMKHRLELMKERKFTKQDWNVREIELCEH